MGRQLLSKWDNFIGEFSTILLKKKYLLIENPVNGEKKFSIGVYCGLADYSYGDLSMYLHLLKSGGNLIFISEPLSAFREHSGQNTFNPWIRARLFVDNMNFLNLSWLNDLYIRNFEEYKFFCRMWKKFSDENYSEEIDENSDEEIKQLKIFVNRQRHLLEQEKYEEFLSGTISYLLERLPENNPISPLVKKNENTGLWEKAETEIMLRCERK